MALIICLLVLLSLLGAHSQFICYVGNVCSSSTSGFTNEEQCCNQVLVRCTSPGCFVTFRDGEVSEQCQHCHIIGFESNTISLNESDTEYEIPIIVSSFSPLSTFTLTSTVLASSNASSGVDFEHSEQTFTYTAGSLPINQILKIRIKKDNIGGEGLEEIHIRLISNPVNVIGLHGIHDLIIKIQDNDKLKVGLNSSFFENVEGQSASVIINKEMSNVRVYLKLTSLTYDVYNMRRASETNLPVLNDITTVPYPTDPAEDKDFNATIIYFEIPGDNTQFTIPLFLFQDMINEHKEGFVVILEEDDSGNFNNPFIDFNTTVAIVQINDDDDFFVGFQDNIYIVNETATTLSIPILTASGNVTEKMNIDVIFQVNPNSGNDVVFSPPPGLILFDQKALINASILPDFILERNETFTLALTSNDAKFFPFDSTQILIIDNEVLELALLGPATIREGSTVDICVNIRQPDSISSDLIILVILTIQTVNAIHAPTGDFVHIDQVVTTQRTLTLSTNHTVECETFLILNDSLAESDETFQLQIQVPSNSQTSSYIDRTIYNPQQIAVTIKDDDMVTIGFIDTQFVYNEDSNTVHIGLGVLEGMLGHSVTVRVEFLDNTALGGRDYLVTTPQDFVLTNTNFMYNVSVNIVDDNITEPMENFNMTLSIIDSGSVNINLMNENPSVFIVDNDRVIIGLLQDIYSISEDVSSVTVTAAVIDGQLQDTTLLNFSIISKTALEGDDYTITGSPLYLDFSSSQRSRNVVININDDNLLEPEEFFLVKLQVVSSAGLVIIMPSMAFVNITDNDRAQIGFRTVSTSIEEGSVVPVDVVVLNGSLSVTISVQFNTLDTGNATSAVDYRDTTELLLFNSDKTNHSVSIEALTDSIYEYEETFLGKLTLLNDIFEGRLSIVPDELLVTILDQTSIKIGLTNTSVAIPESQENITLTVSLDLSSGTLARDVTINYMTEDITAESSKDYIAISRSLVLDNHTTRGQITISIKNDNILETYEQFRVRLSVDLERIQLQERETVITIIDDDAVTVGIVVDKNVFSEENQRADFNISVLTGQLQASFSVLYSTQPGSAMEGVDYEGVTNQSVILSSSQSTHSFHIVIKDETNVENDETFTIFLELPTTISAEIRPRISLQPKSVLLTITDADKAEIGLYPLTISQAENNINVPVRIQLIGGKLEKSVRVSIQTTGHGNNGQILGNTSDLIPIIDMQLTFNNSVRERVISVSLVNDMYVEINEQFNIELSLVNSDSDFEIINSTTIVTIIDDDNIGFLFVRLSPISEEAAVVPVCVRPQQSQRLQRSVDIILNTIEGTATEYNDYNPLINKTLTFTPGVSEQCVNITLMGDDAVEGQEMFSVKMTPPVAAVNVDSDLVITLLDNDAVEIGIFGPQAPVLESLPSVSVTVRVTGKLEQEVIVLVSTKDNTAKESEDYFKVMENVTLSGLTASQSLNVRLREDSLVENSESFIVELQLPQANPGVMLTPQNVQITIIDNDRATVGFIINSTIVNEGSPPVDVCFGLKEGLLERAITVAISSTSTDAILGTDYIDPSGSFTFNATFTSDQCVRFTPNNDDNVERDESVTLHLSTNDSAVDIDGDQVVITITDDDRMSFLFVRLSPISEEAAVVPVCVRPQQSQRLQRSVDIILNTIEGTATEYNDYNPLINKTLTFTPGVSEQCVNITLMGDDAVEGQEMFSVKMTSPVAAVNVDSDLVITLLDNDAVEIGIFGPQAPVLESLPSVSVTVRVTGKLEQEVIVLVSTKDNTAKESEDYFKVMENVTLSGLTASQSLNVRLREDSLVENSESFIVELQLPQANPGVMLTPQNTDITITDNDRVTVGFIINSTSVNEGSPPVDVCFRLKEGSLERAITVAISSTSTDAILGTDYTDPSGSFTFNTTFTSDHCVRFTPNDDDNVERDESVTLHLSTNDSAVDIDGDQVVITITDDDRMSFLFVRLSPISEEAAVVPVCVRPQQSQRLQRSVDIILNTIEGTATEYNDYNPLINKALTFTPGVSEQCVNITLMGDDAVEGQEMFSVKMTSPVAAVNVDSDLVITLLDNDAVEIGIFGPQAPVLESLPSVSVTVRVTGKLEQEVIVLVSTKDNTAKEGEDYFKVMENVTLSGLTVSQSLNVRLREDSLVENSESFIVELQLPQAIAGVMLTPQNTDITITDNDRATVGFIINSTSVNEGSPPVDVCFRLKEGSLERAITVAISSTSTDAILGTDYADPSGSFTFNTTFTSDYCVRFTPNDDDNVERDESVTLHLSTNDSAVDIDGDQVVITITDDDRVVFQFVTPAATYSEDNGVVAACVSLLFPNDTQSLGVAVSGMVTANNVTALEHEDFVLQTTAISFAANSPQLSTSCVQIKIIDDDLVEGPEQFMLHLSSDDPSVQISSVNQPMLNTIIDNDQISGFQCIVNSSRFLSPFHLIVGSPYTDYYIPNCEHKLISSCDVSLNLDIRIDFIDDFSSGHLVLLYNGSKTTIREGPVVDPPSQTSGVIVNSNDNVVIVSIPAIGLSLQHNGTFIKVTVIHSLHLTGLCGTLNGTLIFSDCQRQADPSDTFSVSRFINSHIVEPPQQIVRPQREECGLFKNDTVIGDPLLTVPINADVSNVNLTKPLHLCFEIHGKSDKYFNLISDDCTSVVAHYMAPTNADFLNVIDSVSILAVDHQNQCHEIQISVETCSTTFDGHTVQKITSRKRTIIQSPFTYQGINIRSYSSRVRVSVPNCADASLIMWIICQSPNVTDPRTRMQLGTVKMIKFVVARGFNLHEYSHGLLGQFWNIPLNITKYNGPIKDGDPNANYYTIAVVHPRGSHRQFVGRHYDLSWSRDNEDCLYVGNRQGGPIREVDFPNDPVIEGHYTDYIVNGAFQTMFKYSVFNSTYC